jgi:hypothetical protein
MTLEIEANELEGTAWWRSQKAREFPNDKRNAEAAERLTRLAQELRSTKAPIVGRFTVISDFVFREGDDDDEGMELARRWNEYRSRIGFDNFPDSAEEYLTDLVEIAREAAPSAPYLLGG